MANINGTTSNDTLTGTSSGDTINGDSGADIINSGDGNDSVSGGGGQDTVNLGAGDDDWIVNSTEVVVNSAYGWWGASAIFDSVDGGDGTDRIWVQTDRYTNIDLSKSTILNFEALYIAT